MKNYKMTEKEYRKHPALNYSKLKDFDTSRNKYYKKYILGENPDVVLNDSMKIGSLVDAKTLSLDPEEEYKEKFAVMKREAPIGQLGDFVNILIDVVKIKYLKDNVLTEDMSVIIEDVFDNYFKKTFPDKYKNKKYTDVLLDFEKEDKNGNKASDYFKEAMETITKTVIDNKIFSIGEAISGDLMYGKYTKRLWNKSSDSDIMYQYPVIFDYTTISLKEPITVQCKVLYDRLEINHKKKLITGMDMKVVWDSEGFEFNFFKQRYNFQTALYWLALHQVREDLGLKDYEINKNFFFIVADSTRNYLPYICTVIDTDIQKFITGFDDKFGRHRNGLDEVIENITYCTEAKDFRDSKQLNDGKGIIQLEF